jgi:hypothetical protein
MTISPLQAVSSMSILPVAGAQTGASTGGGFFDGIKSAIANAKSGGDASATQSPGSTPLTQNADGTTAAAPAAGGAKGDGSVGLMDGVLLKAGMGAMAGAGMSFFLPFGPLLGGAIGALAGAGIGLFMNWRKIKNIQTQNVAQVSAMGVQPQNAEQQKALVTGQVAPLGIVPEGSAAQIAQQLATQQTAQQGGTATQQGGTTQTSTGAVAQGSGTATQQSSTAASPVPTQGNGGATQQATNAQVNALVGLSPTGSAEQVLGQTPASGGTAAPTSSETTTGQSADDIWGANMTGYFPGGANSAEESLGGGSNVDAAPAAAPASGSAAGAGEATANDPASARTRLTENQRLELRAARRKHQAKVAAARVDLEHAKTDTERKAALAKLQAARAEWRAEHHRLAVNHAKQAQALPQFTTSATNGGGAAQAASSCATSCASQAA